MIDVELLGVEATSTARGMPIERPVGVLPTLEEVRRLCVLAADSAGVYEGHVAIEIVDAKRIARLNAEYRGEPSPTDVLSFPVDGPDLIPPGPTGPPEARELGDVVICPELTTDVREAIVHGVLHLLGMDHETDDGEMLALQCELLARASA